MASTVTPDVRVWPLAPLQEGLLFHALGDDSALDVYSMQSTYRFCPAPSLAQTSAACAALLRRHEVLRAGFTTAVSERPVQFIAPEVPVPLTVEDLTELSAAEAEAGLERIQRRERETRFVMDRPPLIRFVDVWLPALNGQARSALVVTNHHILFDGWSDALIVTELLAHLAAGGSDDTLPEPPSFGSYLAWLAAQDETAGLRRWEDALDGLDAGTLVAETQTGQTVLPAVVECDLGVELTAGIEAFARSCAVSVSTVFSTVWGLVLRGLTGRDDVVFGTTVSGRPAELAGAEAMVGLFLNTVPQRVTVRPHETVAELMAASHRAHTTVLDAHHVGLGAIQRAAALGPLFDTLYVMRNTPQDDDGLTELSAATGLTELEGGDATHYPLTFIVHPGDSTQLILSYREDRISQEQASAILEAARGLLEQLTADPQGQVGTLRLWPEAAHERWLARTRCGGSDAGQAGNNNDELGSVSMCELLEQTARAHGARTALICGDERLSYEQLWSSIAATAAQLHQAGVQPGDLVGIDVPRGISAVVGIFAVLAAGAAYVPADQAHPPAHRSSIFAHSGVTAVLTGGAAAPTDVPALPVDLPDGCSPSAKASSARQLHPGYRHSDLAYVIHTSGSTGKPKGVRIEHAGLVNMLHNHRAKIFAPAGADRQHPFTVAHAVSFAFDMSWEELLWLIDGHTVLICDDETRHDPQLMVSMLNAAQVDVINVTPSLGEALVEAGLLADHRPRLVLLGGEAVTSGLWARLRDTPGVLGYNLYGPTEYTINTLGGGTDDAAEPTVGSPIAATDVFVLDSSLEPVPDDVPGELWVTGIGLAEGYHQQPALTAERFTACPFGAPGQRMYRTGDIVSRGADGQLRFHSRGDGQVKIRGHRVEPGEVQATLARSALVRTCAVLPVRTPTGSHALVAYVVPAETGHGAEGLACAEDPLNAKGPVDAKGPAGEELRERLRRELRSRLPEHLVPAAVMTLPQLPLTVNSKLDVAALPQPDFAQPEYTPPRTELEEQICEVFGTALGVGECGAEHDLFALGGHSLTAMRVATLLSARLDRRVSVAAVIAAPTPRGLAHRLGTAADAHAVMLALGGDAATSHDAAGDDAEPVLFIHGALGLGWSFSTLAAHLPAGHQAWAVQSPGLAGWPAGRPTDPHGLVEMLVDAIIAELLAAGGTAPLRRVRLIGWSFGAHLTGHLEAALAAHGITVSSAVLLDPGPPSGHGIARDAGMVDGEPDRAAIDPEQEALAFVLRASGTEAPAWLQPPYDRDDVLAHLATSAGVFSHFTAAELDAMLDCWTVNSRLLSELPALVPRADTTLVSAALDSTPDRLTAVEQKWQQLAAAADTRLRTLRMDIDHESFTTPSNAEQLITLLSDPDT